MFINSFSKEIWETTYKNHTDKNVEDTWMRVAKTMSSVEKEPEEWTNKFYSILKSFKFVPGGRILANAGTEWRGTSFINCFVKDRNKYDIDSLDGILSVLRDQSQTLKSEGGWGCNFSFIRPRGSFIHGIGVESPGAVKYMEMFDKSSDIITAGSGRKNKNKTAKGKIRKGAMMGILSIWHPDILEFITSKQSEGRLSKFNISVGMYNDFMEKVVKISELNNQSKEIPKDLDTWELVFPDTQHPKYKEKWFGDIYDWKEKGYPVIVYETVSVVKLWDAIMASTYNRNDPGIIFLDIANKTHLWNYGPSEISKILESNPCVSGDTFVKTNKGQIKIKELMDRFSNGEIFEIYSYSNGEITLNPLEDCFLTRKNANLIELELEDGETIKLTPDHRVFTENRGYIKASQLTNKDILIKIL